MLIDKHAPGWIEALLEAGGPVVTPAKGIRCYALIDCAFMPECYSLIARGVPEGAWQSLYQNAPGASEEVFAHSPLLLDVAAMERPVLAKILGKTDALPMLSFLHSTEPLGALAQHLSRWCVVDADGQYYVLRFPDTRRLPDILNVLRPEQHAAFCGSGAVWHFRARDALWQSFATLEVKTSATPPADVPPVLTRDQCASLIAASEPDELIAALLHLRPDYGTRHAPSRLHALAVRSGLLADAMQLDERTQRMTLCELLMQRPELADTPSREAAALRALLV